MLFSVWAVVVVAAQLMVVPQVVAEGLDSGDMGEEGGGGGENNEMPDYGEGGRGDGSVFNKGQGFGQDHPQNVEAGMGTTASPPGDKQGDAKTTKKPFVPQTMIEMTIRAILQLGMIVGVAILCGSLFMGLVWMEMLMDHLAEKYRKFFDKPEPIPDIERLHPAELVGTFARYK